MSNALSISVGQHSSAGVKAVNQDRCGVLIPEGHEKISRGIIAAIADGISSSDVSQEASEVTITSLLQDYYATPESWSVKTAGERVLQSINAWLYGRSRNSEYRYDRDKGYICTFSGIIFKGKQAHLFHAGDSRIYHFSKAGWQQLTTDHRQDDPETGPVLSQAMGLEHRLFYDYRSVPLNNGDLFVLATDGIYAFISPEQITELIQAHQDDLQQAAEHLTELALAGGSDDNLTVQLIRIDTVAKEAEQGIPGEEVTLSLPPDLAPGMQFEGYEVLRELYVSSRSHVFLARDIDSGSLVALKTLSTDLEDDPDAIERFLMEDWIAKRLDNVHCLKAFESQRPRQSLYSVTEYIEGQTLSQWIHDNPQPALDEVRRIVAQVGKGLQAMHRREMIHQDIRPDNVLIDNTGTIKIIDYGSTRIAGLAELGAESELILGTAQFTAPEYFLGQAGTAQSDIFSLGVLTYHLLTGDLPYGTSVSSAFNEAAQRKLNYRSLLQSEQGIPFWVDDTIKKAVHIQPHRRYQEVAEFVYDLHHPNKAFLNKARPPLIDRNPVLFWQCVSLGLLLILLFQNLPEFI
jgi:serine/threonine protein phosphatase PrpC